METSHFFADEAHPGCHVSLGANEYAGTVNTPSAHSANADILKDSAIAQKSLRIIGSLGFIDLARGCLLWQNYEKYSAFLHNKR